MSSFLAVLIPSLVYFLIGLMIAGLIWGRNSSDNV